jgi:hypothetical protein
MGRLIGLIILIIDIVAVLDIVRSNKDMEKKILWVIAVVLLPILGPILYFLLGKNKA